METPAGVARGRTRRPRPGQYRNDTPKFTPVSQKSSSTNSRGTAGVWPNCPNVELNGIVELSTNGLICGPGRITRLIHRKLYPTNMLIERVTFTPTLTVNSGMSANVSLSNRPMLLELANSP